MLLALVSDYAYPNGGVEQVVRALLGAVPPDVDVELVTWAEEVLRPAAFGGEVSMPENGDIRAVWSALARADIVLVHTSFNVRLLARLATDFLRTSTTPGVTVVHTSSHSDPFAGSVPAQDQWLRDLVKVSRRTIAVSPSVAAAIDRLVPGAPAVVTMENASRFRQARRLRAQREVVSFIGRPFPSKGFDVFEDLVRSLRIHRPELRFRANTVSVPVVATKSLQVSALLDDADYLAFLDEADVLVAPYRGADGLPLAILEALSCGVPVIGLDSAGLGDLLRAHHQVVVPEPSLLESTVLSWADGALDIPAPRADRIPTWDDVAADYYRLIADVLEECYA